MQVIRSWFLSSFVRIPHAETFIARSDLVDAVAVLS